MKRWLLLTLCLCLIAMAANEAASLPPNKGTVTVFVFPKPANTIVPSRALGYGVDGLEKGDIARVYTPANIKAMRSAGFGPLTYRLRTELGVEAWHWNPRGTFSDAARRQGYWTSDARAAGPIAVCNGYRLPRRGNTWDQAENDGYSRLDDGDAATFWKSNPYLARPFTGDDDALHPQWVVVDFGARRAVNAIRIAWGIPYATRYRVEYWRGDDPDHINENLPGAWTVFPGGRVLNGRGGAAALRLASRPVSARYVRLWLERGSETAPSGCVDVRDRRGFAIRELRLGTQNAGGAFHDLLRHAPNAHRQTVMFTSSTDPWHRAVDLDANVEQPGFDRVFRSGLGNGQGVMMPVPLIYDTPENAVAELRWLRARGYPVSRVEMGEEPDGQYMSPEDYGALYAQWADALHRVDPTMPLGGPGFQTTIADYKAWPDARGNGSWVNRFLACIRRKGHARDFNFFSFEWYPFDDMCAPPGPQLARATDLLTHIVHNLSAAGLPRSIPWLITEYGYSSYAGRAEVDVPGAIFNADAVAHFLTLGGAFTAFYGTEPNTLIQEQTGCGAWGNLALFLADDDRHIHCPLPAYYGALLLTRCWLAPANAPHALFPATCDVRDKDANALVTVYAARHGGRWSLLLLNKDLRRGASVSVGFKGMKKGAAPLRGPLELYQYSPQQYEWRPDGPNGHPTRNLPPAHALVTLGADGLLTLPPASITVLRERE